MSKEALIAKIATYTERKAELEAKGRGTVAEAYGRTIAKLQAALAKLKAAEQRTKTPRKARKPRLVPVATPPEAA